MLSKPHYITYGIELKKQILNETHSAKMAHKRWVRRVNHLVNNLPVDIQTIPIDSKKSQFGVWLYSSGMKCKKIPQLTDYIHQIEYLHIQLHHKYQKVHTIYSSGLNRSWLMSMLIPSRNVISLQKQKTAQRYFNDIEKLSHALLTLLDLFERHLAIQANAILLTLL